MKKLQLTVLAMALTMNAQGVITWAAGAPGGTSGGSLSLDGTESIGLGVAAADIGDYTISMWLNPNAAGEQWFLGTGNRGLHLGIRDTANAGDGSNTLSQGHWGNDSDGTTQILANAWVHATFTYDNATDTQTIYVNGVQDSQTVTGDPNNTSTNLILGNRDNTRGPGYNGQIDDVAIWNSVLSATAVATVASGDATGANAYWDFEDPQSGETAANSGVGLNAIGIAGITAIPEPSALALVLVGAAGFMRRKRA